MFRFLLTRPSRDVTYRNHFHNVLCLFLLTRPSRDVTDFERVFAFSLGFLLTRPSRDVTIMHDLKNNTLHISTHTSLAGRDNTKYTMGTNVY